MRKYEPKENGVLGWLRAGAFYVYAAAWTLVVGLLGLPLALARGRAGFNAVATRWLDGMMWGVRIIAGVRVEIRGDVPMQDCIVAAKHQSFLDVLAIAHAVPRRVFIMKRVLLMVPVMGWYARKVGCIPIDRARGADAMAQISTEVRAAMQSPEGLGQLIIYPEGTRTKPGEKRRYKWGAVNLQRETGLPLVPVAVNAGMFWPKRGIPIRPGVTVITFLPAIKAGQDGAAVMAELHSAIEGESDRLMAAAGLVLPS